MWSLAKYILGGSDQPEQRQNDNLDDDPYDDVQKIDQVVNFFENEYEAKYEHVLTVTERESMEQEQVLYYNAMNGVNFQNEQIGVLIDELLELRKSRPLNQEQRIRWGHLKLDIGDRRSKRNKKERERLSSLERIRPLIASVQTQLLLAKHEAEALQQEGHATTTMTTPRKYDRVPEEDIVAESTVSTLRARGGTVRKLAKHYTDKEIQSLLKDMD